MYKVLRGYLSLLINAIIIELYFEMQPPQPCPTATWHNDAKAIANEVAAIKAIQGGYDLTLSEKPRKDWSANA